jgi:Tfp pilus assembly protein PilX
MLAPDTYLSRNPGEKGTALVVSLLLMLVLSVLSASMMFLAQTETASSASYKLMSQARYGAESGVHHAINYLTNTYALPGTPADPLTNYDLTKSPVRNVANNQPVILSSNTGVWAPNYPVPAVQTAFNNAVRGTLAAGGQNVSYNASAKLLRMTQLTTYGGISTVVQTWEITADGTVAGARTATVEVTSTLEQQFVPAAAYAAFATGAGCGALNFGGDEVIDSYDSRNALVGGAPQVSATGGNVGTNGNMTLSGQATIDGTLSTPRTGVGSCTSGNVDALSLSGQATVTQGLVKLPQTVVLPPPDAPNPMPPSSTSNDFTKNSGCAGAGGCSFVTVSMKDVATLTGGTQAAPLVLGDVSVDTQGTLHLTAGYYNVNSITAGSQGSIIIDSGPVIMNVAGQGQSTPIDFSSGSVSNPTFDAGNFQILYAGTGDIKLNGGAQNSMVVYAPNATASFPASNSNFYGSITVSQISSNGAQVHYDRRLGSEFFVPGNHMLTAFTWKKY